MTRKRIRHMLADGEIKASLLCVWIEQKDGKQVGLSLDAESVRKFYHKKARLVLEVEP